ncbi:MAG: LLM class F420-dependent oxidoreductase [Ilumatobacteraceae bacterium]|nr:LLM class F420-dependent oxidoreductase [Ilumatobacteraceae bacterium]
MSAMKVGIVYPQTELGGDPQALHDIGLAVEAAGYDTLLIYDHVVGAEHTDREPPLWGPYTEADPFHDPFVAFGYLAGITSRIELATSVVILPQRQTVLVAQQAADVDLLSQGRLRLGVGVGWNYVEYDALGQDFSTRGARLDEQVPFLRRLWTEPLVTFEGRFDRIERGCINPRPRRSIPIWVGGFGEAAFRRGGRLGDGFTFAGGLGGAIEGLAQVRRHLAEAGRTEDGFGFELITTRAKDLATVVETAERWQEVGGTQLAVVTMGMGLRTAAEHLDVIHAVRDALAGRIG